MPEAGLSNDTQGVFDFDAVNSSSAQGASALPHTASAFNHYNA